MDWNFFHSVNRRGHDGIHLSGDDPPGTFWTEWFGGVFVPIVLAGYAAYGWIARSIWLPDLSRRGPFGVWFDGFELHCAAGILISTAVILHAYGFWGQRYSVDHPAVKLPQIFGLLVGTGCVAAWSWQWIVNG